MAARACEFGRIASNGQAAKAAREIRIGDLLQVKNDSGEFQVEILALSEMRGPAAVAQTLYRETGASRESRLKLAEERKAMVARIHEHLAAGRDVFAYFKHEETPEGVLYAVDVLQSTANQVKS